MGHFREPYMIELTDQQRQAVRNGEAVRVTAPELGEDVVLLRATEYETMRESLQDRTEQSALLRYSMKQVAKAAHRLGL